MMGIFYEWLSNDFWHGLEGAMYFLVPWLYDDEKYLP